MNEEDNSFSRIDEERHHDFFCTSVSHALVAFALSCAARKTLPLQISNVLRGVRTRDDYVLNLRCLSVSSKPRKNSIPSPSPPLGLCA